MMSSMATTPIILMFVYIIFQLDGLFAFRQHESKDPYTCYDPKDKGLTYNGNVNITNNGKSCLFWTNVTQCFKHPYKLGLKINNLQHNYCRNPDSDQQLWCYTNKACSFDFCDVDQCQPDQLVECKPPSTPIDGLVVGTIRPYYRLGEQVQFQCKSYISKVSKTCLSNGQWSEAGTACIDISQCYDPRDKGLTYNGNVHVTIHKKTCLPWEKVKHCNYNPYTKGLKINNLEHNYCRNPDNSPQPWCYIDNACDYDFCHVCQIDAPREDFLDSQCPDLINSNPSMCEDFPQFADKFCYKTCHTQFCDVPTYGNIKREPNRNQVKIGEIVSFTCPDNTIKVSGDSQSVCQPSGTLAAAKPLLCKDVDDLLFQHYGINNYQYLDKFVPASKIFIGINQLYTVMHSGQVVAWQFVADIPTTIHFQVWRRTRDPRLNIYQMIGQNIVTVNSTQQAKQVYVVPDQERIHVADGDFVGFLVTNRGSIRYTKCRKTTATSPGFATYVPPSVSGLGFGDRYRFHSSELCVVFSFRAVVNNIGL